jgi:hypothetical protein
MPYQEKAQIIFKYLRANFPKCSVGHRWDFKIESEWYFLQHEKLRIRILVPKMFFKSHDGDEIVPKLEALYLDNYIRSGQSHYIVIDNSGLNVETF